MKATLFYAYYGLIASTNPVWLQWIFDILIGLFERFGIINNLQRDNRKWVLSTLLLSVVPIGCLHYNLWEVLLGVGSVCDSLWVRVEDYHPPYNSGAGEYPVLVDAMDF